MTAAALAGLFCLFTAAPAHAGSLSDDFSRTIGGGFGGAWSGPACGSVDGAEGVCISTPSQPRADRLATWTGTTSNSLFVAQAEFKLDRLPTVGELTHGVKRLFPDGAFWFVELVARPGSLKLQLQTITAAGVKTTWKNVPVPNVSAQTAWVWVWCSQNGTRVKGKAWEEGDPVPASLFDKSNLPSWVAQDGSLAVQFGHGADEPGTAVHRIDNLTASWS